MLAVPSDHSLARAVSVTLADLAAHETLWMDDGLDVDVFAFQEQAGIDEDGVTIRRCPTLQDALSLCEAGLGVTILPDMAIPRGSSLCYIPIAQLSKGALGFYYLREPEGLLQEFVALTEGDSGAGSQQ